MFRILVFQVISRKISNFKTNCKTKSNRRNHLETIWIMTVLEILKHFSICVLVLSSEIKPVKSEKFVTIVWRNMLYLNTVIKSINIAPFNLETKSVTKFYEIVVSFFHKISFFHKWTYQKIVKDFLFLLGNREKDLNFSKKCLVNCNAGYDNMDLL